MIEHIKSYNSRTIFLCIFTIAGLVSSRAVMSIGTIALFVNILLAGNYKNTIKNFYKNKALFSLSFLFFAALISLSYSSNVSVGFQSVINKLPLIVMPLALSRFENFTKSHLYILTSFFVFATFISSLFVLGAYVQNFQTDNINLKQGQAIWVPLNHIRYSIVVAFALISAVYLFINHQLVLKNKFVKFKYIYFFLAFFFFVLIHVLAIRSAILTLYISIVFSLIYFVFKTKKFKEFILLSIVFMSIPFIAYNSIDSFSNRFNYMKYDIEQYKKNKIGHNSDSKRIRSIGVGIDLVKESFPLGFGTGEIKERVDEYYKKRFPDIIKENRLSPHNQFFYTLIDYGLLGFIALCFTLFYPFVYLKKYKYKLFYYLFWTISFVPLLYDISLEMQLGITFYALFSAVFIKYISDQKSYQN